MKSLNGILLLVLFLAHSAFAFLMFDEFNSNVIIPFILLVGLGTWIGGRTVGLMLTLISIISSCIIFQFNADRYTYYIDRVTGLLIMMICIETLNRLKSNINGIRELNMTLEHMVNNREKELSRLSNELLQKAERRRSETGQQLHDGIGQQLTGIKLLCASLEQQLSNEPHSHTALAAALTNRVTLVHENIRHIARALFPIRMAQVGLVPALNEMISCLSDQYNKQICLSKADEIHDVLEPFALQLYRICQESCTFLLKHGKANIIRISLNSRPCHLIMNIEHDGSLEVLTHQNGFELIQYRIQNIRGEFTHTSSPSSGCPVLRFKIPKSIQGLPS